MLNIKSTPVPEKHPVQQALDGMKDAFEQATASGESAREENLRAFVAGVRLGSNAAFDHARRTSEMMNSKTNNSLTMAINEIEGFINDTMSRIHSEPMESPASLARRFSTSVTPVPHVAPVTMLKPAPEASTEERAESLNAILDNLNKQEDKDAKA